MDYSYSSKYHQMIRVYDKLTLVSTDNRRGIDNSEARDLAEEFFNQCYHLKDWIKKDSTIGSHVDVEAYIAKTRVLQIAADYCNSLKHAGLDRKSRSGGQIEKINTHMSLDLTPRGWLGSSQVEFVLAGKKYNAYRLATDSVAAWRSFFALHKIVLNEP